MKAIVVGYDDGEPAKRALARAAEFAPLLGAKLVVTSVARVLSPAAAAHGVGPVDPVDPPEVHREELAHARGFLEGLGLEATYAVTIGDPAAEILELAEEHDADLIVVGSRPRNVFERLLDPSVSGAVQRRAHRDVLIVH